MSAVPGIVLVLAAAAASAQEAGLEDAWRWRVFDRSEGLSSTFISALHQDRYEFIYAATEKGVCRYDLWEWTVLENGDPFNDGDVLRFVESSGEIYAVTRNALWKVQGGTRLDLFYRGGGLHAASSRLGEVYAIEEREARHFQVRGETTERVDPEVRLPPGRVLDYEIDAGDIHWLATSEGLFFRDLSRRVWRAVEDRDLDAPLQGLRCTRFFRISGKGTQRPLDPREEADELWALFQGARPQGARAMAARLEGSSWRALGAPDGPPLARIVRSHDRVLHGTTEDGSLHVSTDGKSWARVESPGVGKVALQAGIVDSAGMLWFRQGTGGLATFDGQSRRWESIPSGAGGSFPNVLSVIETDDGEVWMGMTSGVSRSRPGVAPEFFAEVQGVALEKITGLAEDSLRRVWVSSAESFPGALCFDGTGWVKESVPGFSEHPVRRIVKDHAGEIWFLSQGRGPDGAYLCYRSSVYTSYELETVRLGHGPINDLVRSRDEEDSFWIATDEGLIAAVLEDGSFRVDRRYTDQDGLRSIRVWSVATGHDGAVWISYPGGGVTRLKDGAPSSFDESNGLMSSEVWSIVLAGQSLWFGTDRGLSRFEGDCWYGYSIESAVPRACCRVWPLAVSRIETDSVIAGTFGLGAVRLRLDDRRRPRFMRGELPARISEGAAATFRWDARDYRNQTPPAALLSRSRIDGGAWTAFSTVRSRDVKDLPAGRHTLEVEVRDLDGNRTRDPFVHDFDVGSNAGDRSLWVALVAGGALLAAVAGWRLALRWAVEGRRRTRQRSFFADHPRPVILFDREGRVLDWNGARPEWIGLEGVGRADLLGRPLDLLPFASTVAFRAALKGLLEGRPFHLREHPAADAAGGARILDVTGFPLGPGGIEGAVVIFDDRTREVEERRLGERDRRLSSLRTLAGRIASSFGGLLEECLGDQGVRANASLTRRLREAESVARRLSTFAGPEGEASRSAAFPVKGLLDRLAGSPPALHRSGAVKVDLERPDDLQDVTGDERLLEDAFIEVLKNAADAMRGTGSVTLRARNLRIDDDPGTLPPGDYVEVTITDTGTGIHAADLDLLFEPFYSTKPRDRALGIGLSLAMGIVRAAGGDIRVASSPGAGTTVTVFLQASG